jgi:DNA-binding NarL/FixJ family response regulator
MILLKRAVTAVNDRILSQRARPCVAMLDERFEIVFADPHGRATCRSMISHVRRLVEEGREFSEIEHDGVRYVLRVSHMVGDEAVRYAMALEPRGTRQPVIDAMDRFGLTPREVDVLGLILDGAPNRQIAATLCIVEGTVQEHVRNLCRKTKSRRRGDLLARVFGVEPADTA